MDHEESESDFEDEWFYSSIKRYRQLLMFDLEFMATAMEISSPESICISGTRAPGKYEILDTAFPHKLCKPEAEEGLCKNRDLAIKSGVFTKSPVVMMKNVAKNRSILVSEEKEMGVKIYSLGANDTDLMHQTSAISNEMTAPLVDVHEDELLLGVTTDHLELYDLQSCQKTLTVSLSSDVRHMSNINILSSHLISACDAYDGTAYISDIRQVKSISVGKVDAVRNKRGLWSMATSSLPSGVDKILRVSSQGIFVVNDIRNLQETLLKGELGVPLFSRRHLVLRFSPASDKVFSISGCDHQVHVFEMASNEVKRIFIHDGHGLKQAHRNKFVTSHVWHPLEKNVVFSASENASLHAWQFLN